MQVTITLTPEQILQISQSVNTVSISEVHADEIVKHILTEAGEKEELTAKRAEFQKDFDKYNANKERYSQRNYHWVDDQMKGYKSLRSRVIEETAALAKSKLMLDNKESIAAVAKAGEEDFRAKIPEILIGAYTAQFMLVMREAFNAGHMSSGVGYLQNEIQQLQQRLSNRGI